MRSSLFHRKPLSSIALALVLTIPAKEPRELTARTRCTLFRAAATLSLLAISAPAYAQSCAGGSWEAFSIVGWSVEAEDSFGYPSAAIAVTLKNEMETGFRLVDGIIQFADALGGSLGAIEIPRTTGAAASAEFEVSGTYTNRTLATLAEIHPDDVIITACVRGAISDAGEVIEHPRASSPVEPLSDAMIAQVRAAAQRCWTPPPGALAAGIEVWVSADLNPDGSIASTEIISALSDDLTRSTAFAAQRAIERCAPYTMLPEASYEEWQTLRFEFDASGL